MLVEVGNVGMYNSLISAISGHNETRGKSMVIIVLAVLAAAVGSDAVSQLHKHECADSSRRPT